MRGLELRKGTVDLVVNDLVAGHRLAAAARRADAGRDGGRHRLRLHRAEPAGSGAAAISRCARRSATRSIATPSSSTCAAASRPPAVGIVPPMSWAFERERVRLPARSGGSASGCSMRPGYPDPDGAGPLPRLRLSLKTSTSEVYRLQAAAIQQDLARVGIALDVRSSRAADAARRTCAGAISSCTRCSGSASPIPTCCGWSITRASSRRSDSIACTTERRRRSADRRGVGGDRRRAPRRALHARRSG